DGIDYIHIGLNDLHLGYGMKFMFELLADGTVETLCNKIKDKGIPYGFGGIAQLGHGELPAEYVIAEHHRLGSSMAILSRSFCNVNKIKGIEEAQEVFDRGISEVRKFESILDEKNNEYFDKNMRIIGEKISEIVGR